MMRRLMWCVVFACLACVPRADAARRGDEDAGAATVHDLLNQGALAPAESLARGPVTTRTARGDTTSTRFADALTLLAEVLLRHGGARQVEEARALTRRAVALSDTALATATAADAERLFWRGMALTINKRRADFPEALAQHERARQIRERRGLARTDAMARSLHELGVLAMLRFQISRADSLTRASLAIREALFRDPDIRLAESHTSLGNIQILRGDYPGARTHFETALRQFRAVLGPANGLQRRTLAGLSICAEAIGDTTSALRLMRDAADVSDRMYGVYHPAAVQQLADLSLVEERLGAGREAREHGRESLRRLERIAAPDAAELIAPLAEVGRKALTAGDTTEAGTMLRRARALAAARGDTASSRAAALAQAWGLYRVTAGDTLGALVAYEQAIRGWSAMLGPRSPHVAEVHGIVAQLAAARRDWARAVPAARAWTEALDATYGLNDETIVALLQRARIERAAGESAGALAAAWRAEEFAHTRAVRAVRLLSERETATTPLLEHQSVGEAWNALRDTVATAADREQVWDAVIRGRSLALEELAERHRRVRRAEAPDLAALDSALTQAREAWAAALVAEAAGADVTARLDSARDAAESAERALATADVRFRTDRAWRDARLADVRAALPPQHALVAYALLHDSANGARYVAFVLRDGVATVHDLGDAAVLDDLVARWRGYAGRDPAATRDAAALVRACGEAGAALRRAMWDPLARDVAGCAALHVVPDGALHAVNLLALPSGERAGRFLAETLPPCHVRASERDLLAPAVAAPEGHGLLALGAPAFDDAPPAAFDRGLDIALLRGGDCAMARFAPLPATRDEARAVADAWRARVPDEAASLLVDAEANGRRSGAEEEAGAGEARRAAQHRHARVRHRNSRVARTARAVQDRDARHRHDVALR